MPVNGGCMAARSSASEKPAQLEPLLLPGEVLVASADDVLLYLPLSERPDGVLGRLVVTNFKLTFLEARNQQGRLASMEQRNLLLGPRDICLMNVDTIHQLLSSSGKTKRLYPRSTVQGKIKGIQIRCKDFRLFTFSLNLTSVNEAVAVTSALLNLCYPQSVHLLFAFSYRGGPATGELCDLGTPAYWQAELRRTGALGWRVSQANELYQMCRSLPEVLVVPKGLLDADLVAASGHFVERRPPIWCWGNAEGAAIVRSAYTHPDMRNSPQERRLLDAMRASQPFMREPVVQDVGAACPTAGELQESYQRLRQLCSPDSLQALAESDGRFLSQLSASRWLWAVSRCLGTALDCVDVLTTQRTVCVLTGERRPGLAGGPAGRATETPAPPSVSHGGA
ncbi:myotubularin-related protein 10-like [Pollicipes pollicipes]|uniref:myotubularin-related protein 10-like n=1 Tax=Pollicipes pollicipes TaxID=41117 RepID=UPI001884F1A2|nr:myotubularin-related protein 10-like [Pollicipes pollicipes]